MTSFLILLVGLILAHGVNWATFHLAYFPQNKGPWGKAPEGCATRTWFDAIPLLGWYRLRRESPVHGRRFWVWPLLVELLFPIALLGLYWYEMQGGLLAKDAIQLVRPQTLWIQFLAHASLITFLLIATCIDLNERCIPDTITLPGTFLALMGAAFFADWHLMAMEPSAIGLVVAKIHPASPSPWNPSWNGTAGLQWALLSFSIWCFALADRRWITRRGWKKAWVYFLAGLTRHWTWKLLVGIWLVGCIAIVIAQGTLPVVQWQNLFSSLIGMPLGCSVVWFIRIVARWAMGREAMGFGDVTLMAMVGAYLGWQPAWLAFFVAPVLAILIVLIVWLVTGDPATPFGPYLAAGTVVILLGWNMVWNQWAVPRIEIFGGTLLFWGFLSFLVLLGGTLWGWLQVKRMLLQRWEDR